MEVKLSAVIITYNEARNIARCLDSVQKVADEILVVDSFSEDATKQICLKKRASFIEHTFEGHIEQKNYAKAKAKYDHILSLDADEALDEELQANVFKIKQNWEHDAYKMNRLTNYCGAWVHHSGWYPDTKIRLFDRRIGDWGGSNPHDKFIPQKGVKVKWISGDILHYSFYDRAGHLQQIEKFSSIAARALHQKGKRSTFIRRWVNPAARFIKAYILRLGFLDGKAGFDIARFSAYANWLKYQKLRKLQSVNHEAQNS